MASTGLHISISAETIGHVGPIPISNSMLTSLIAGAILIAFAFAVRTQLKEYGKPGRLQTLAEMIIEGFQNLIQSVTGSQVRTRLFFPLITTFFLYILINNWLGLFPGVGTIGFRETRAVSKTEVASAEIPSESQATVTDEHTEVVSTEEHSETAFVPYFRAGTADLNTTLALAIISVVATQIFGFHFLKFSYFSKFINFSNPIAFFVGLLEAVLEMAKIISFAFRLFGNIFAGEVLLAVISFLVPIIAPIPFYGLEVIVGVIQALVFAMLSVVFFNMATVGHSEEH